MEPGAFLRGAPGSGPRVVLSNTASVLTRSSVAVIDVVADMVEIEETVRPQPAAAAVYASLLPVFTELYERPRAGVPRGCAGWPRRCPSTLT